MPRGPSGSYTYPDGTRGISGQTIYSARYNTFLDDLATTLNTALPVNMGGTGGSTVTQARDNLDAEVSMQTVTNYDSHPWETGSFKSSPGAVNSPDGAGAATNWFVGTVQVFDSTAAVVEARNLVTGVNYMRKKNSGTWGAWTVDSNEAAFVKKAGDTMTGALTVTPKGSMFGSVGGTAASGSVVPADANIKFYDFTGTTAGNWSGMGVDSSGDFWLRTGLSGASVIPAIHVAANKFTKITGNLAVEKANPQFILSASGSSQSLDIVGQQINVTRWLMQIPDSSAVGDFAISRFDDSGNQIGSAPVVLISRVSGMLTLRGDEAISKADPTFILDKVSGAGGANSIVGTDATRKRWVIQPGDGVAESSGNVGSNFAIYRYDDSGNQLGSTYTLYIERTTGNATLTGNLSLVKSSPVFTLNAAPSGEPGISMNINGVRQSMINDNGSSLNIYSNTALTTGMYIAHGASAWTAISDARLPYKRSARDITGSLPQLDAFRLYENEVNGSLEMFAKAQELAELFPHVVKQGDADPDYVPSGPGDPRAWGINYDRLGVIALAYIRQQDRRIAELMARIEALEAK